MNKEKLIQVVQKANFSENTEKEIIKIIDQMVDKLTNEQIDNILELIDFEIEASHIEADVLEELALELENYASSMDNISALTAHKIDRSSDNLVEQAKKVGIDLPSSDSK